MKKIKILFILPLITLLMIGCSDDDANIFIADLYADEITFENNFASEYLISDETSGNIADRFIWNDVTTVTTNQYELQASSTIGFEDHVLIGITNQNNHIVLVEDLLNLADELSLDNDPETTDGNGNPNNSGTVYFRVKASIGNGGAGSDEIMSEIANLNIKIIEAVVNNDECNPLYVLGEGITDADWNFPGIELTCDSNILQAKANLQNGHFRFFTTVGDWDSGLDYTYYENEGYSIDDRLENAPAGDNFNFVGTPGIYTITINTIDKSIVLQESLSLWAVGGAVPGGWNFNDDTVELVETAPNVWSASINLNNDIFRFFQSFGTWNTNNNYAYYEDQGYIIDANFEVGPSEDANFNFIGNPGTYQLNINAVDKTITLN